jgi:hypothetical protein
MAPDEAAGELGESAGALGMGTGELGEAAGAPDAASVIIGDVPMSIRAARAVGVRRSLGLLSSRIIGIISPHVAMEP